MGEGKKQNKSQQSREDKSTMNVRNTSEVVIKEVIKDISLFFYSKYYKKSLLSLFKDDESMKDQLPETFMTINSMRNNSISLPYFISCSLVIPGYYPSLLL